MFANKRLRYTHDYSTEEKNNKFLVIFYMKISTAYLVEEYW
jgi:hypothetical protein